MQYSRNSFCYFSEMLNAVITLSFFSSSDALVVPSYTLQSTYIQRSAFLMMQPFLHISSDWTSVRQMSHFSQILMNWVSTMKPSTLIMCLTMQSVGIVLINQIEFLASKSVNESFTCPITQKCCDENCNWVQISIQFEILRKASLTSNTCPFLIVSLRLILFGCLTKRATFDLSSVDSKSMCEVAKFCCPCGLSNEYFALLSFYKDNNLKLE